MKFFKKHSLVLSLALIAVLLFSASLLQKKYDDIVHPQILFTTETRYVLPAQIKRAYKNYLKQTLTGTKPSGEINNDLIKTIYDTTKSETTKKIIEDGVMVNTLTEIIQTLVKKYRTLYGEYPQSIDLLAEKKMIQLAPLLKEKFTITINQNTGAVTVTPKKSIK